jgi:hypothetical protein
MTNMIVFDLFACVQIQAPTLCAMSTYLVRAPKCVCRRSSAPTALVTWSARSVCVQGGSAGVCPRCACAKMAQACPAVVAFACSVDRNSV